MFEIEFYRTPRGICPVESFLDSLEGKLAAKAANELLLLAEKGNVLREPHSKAMGDGLFELRIKHSTSIARFFYFFAPNERIVVTGGYLKKTAKTPAQELRRARAYMEDWKARNSHG